MDAPDAPLSLCDVLEDEYDELHGPAPAGHAKLPGEAERLAAIFGKIHAVGRTALCISGGGIRSATFALGVVQALARHELLDKFHYLSTVSGGGYVGSWLSAWIHRSAGGLKGVCAQLNAPPVSKLEPEPAPIRYLRAYSNYLTPRLGLLSADTWTLVAIYLRNLLLNWLVLLPALVAVLALPRLAAAVTLTAPRTALMDALLALGALLAVMAIVFIGAHRPSAQTHKGSASEDANAGSNGDGDEQGRFLRWCLLPLVASAAVLTTYWSWQARLGVTANLRSFALFGFGIHVAAWVVYSIRWRRFVPAELLVVMVTGFLGGLLAWVAATKAFPEPGVHPLLYACFAVPTFLVLLLVAGTVFVGVASRFTTDDDREWAARFGAWVLIVIVLWAAGGALVILGPIWFADLKAWVASLGGISGAVAVLLGSSARSSNAPSNSQTSWTTSIMSQAPRFAAPVFLVVLAIMLSWGSDWLLLALDRATPWLPAALPGLLAGAVDSPSPGFFHAAIVTGTGIPRVLLFVTAMMAFAAASSWFVNINNFSLHSMYRNRLIRAYLGASREKGRRRPDAFTGFDPEDNLPMSELWPPPGTGGGPRGLFHVVNCTLNLVKGEKLAWQERKAESFTITPLHSGSHHLNPGYRRSRDYACSGQDKGGISLGTAVAISGAAASPNMGYHSSPVVTFLMALFNARLGWWLGNPGTAGKATCRLSNPNFALRPMVDEALGLTDDGHPYVYMSDGGHFENLALYEMVLRRCHLIVVSDAGCDPDYTFEDLGNAIRKIRVDFGIPIQIEHLAFGPGTAAGARGLCRAVGTIHYEAVDPGAPPGTLIYLKPGLLGNEPADVGAYAQARRVFPHEPTSDQWFSESQFESYRALGFHVVDEICSQAPATLQDMAERIRALAGPTLTPTPTGLPTMPPETAGPAPVTPAETA